MEAVASDPQHVVAMRSSAFADPVQHPGAHKFETIEYTEVLTRGLEVMDATAISLCRDNGLPILVFDFRREGNIRRILSGEPIGTLVHGAAT